MKSIRLKLILVTLILIIVPFFVSNILNVYFVANDYKTVIEKNSKMMSSSIADNVQLFVEKAYGITYEIANNSDLREIQQLYQFLYRYMMTLLI